MTTPATSAPRVLPTNIVPVRPPTRDEVYAVIDGERDYQELGKGNAKRHPTAPANLLSGEIIACSQKCLNDALAAWYAPDGGVACLPYLRKVAALCVQAMEHYGSPARVGHDPKLPPMIGQGGQPQSQPTK